MGVNEYVMDEKPFPILYIDETVGGGADGARGGAQGRVATTARVAARPRTA